MTYQIYWEAKDVENDAKRYVLFEIEFCRKHADTSFDWISEIHCLPIVKGISNFLKDKLSSNDFVFEEFVNDASEIQEIRRMLYEADFDNSPKPQREAYLWHYNIFGKFRYIPKKAKRMKSKYLNFFLFFANTVIGGKYA